MTRGGKRTKNKDGGTPTKSPNRRDKKRGKKEGTKGTTDDNDEEMTPTRLFRENASSDATDQTDEAKQNHQDNGSDSQSSGRSNEEPNEELDDNEEDTIEFYTEKEVQVDPNDANIEQDKKYDLAAPPPPKMWMMPIAASNNEWKRLPPATYSELTPVRSTDLNDPTGDEIGLSVRAIIDLGIELIQGELHDKNPTIGNWLQVIQSVLLETNTALEDYTRVRNLVFRLAQTDPVKAFDAPHWFNNGLNQTEDVHRLWIATYLTFGAPWKDRDTWFPKTTTTEIINPYKNNRKIVQFGNNEPKKSALKSVSKTGQKPISNQTYSMFLNKPLVPNAAKSQILQKTKDYSRNYKTYVKLRLAQVTAEAYADQESEVAASLKTILNHIWTIDNTMVVLPWRREESFPPLRKGSDSLRSKSDVDKYVDRCWMEKNKAPYCRMLIAHNATRDKIFEDAALQNWVMTSQLMLQVERIQAHTLSKAGHLLGFHSTVCNCDNLADAIQQHPKLQGISIEIRSEFITFKIGRGPPKPTERTKTKIVQVYVASDSAGRARRALTEIYSSQSKGRYPLGVTARFIPNVNDLRFVRPPQVSMAYMNSLKKHIEFMKNTTTFSSENIIELDAVIDRFKMSLRQAIMHIFSASKPNWNLFVAVDTSYYGNCVNFAFREELQEEAMNMISALPLFLEAYLGHSDVWKWFTRRAREEAADFEWNLQKGLVPKYDTFMDTQLEDWEQLDEVDDANETSAETVLQPFKLDLHSFGTNTYGDENTIQTSALLEAARKNSRDSISIYDSDDDDNSMTDEPSRSSPRGISVTTETTAASTATSTLTASPDQLLFAEFHDDPEFVALLNKLRIKKSIESSLTTTEAGTENENHEHK